MSEDNNERARRFLLDGMSERDVCRETGLSKGAVWSVKKMMAAAPVAASVDRLPAARILVGKRVRREMGDIVRLAHTIDVDGMLQPVVVKALPSADAAGHTHQLVAGARRLEAWQWSKFAADPVPVHVVDIASIRMGEFVENDERLDFTPSEAVEMKRLLEAEFDLKGAAAERKRAGRPRRPDAVADDSAERISAGNLPEDGSPLLRERADGEGSVPPKKGEVAEIAAAFTGKSRRTVEKAAAVVAAAARDPETYGPLVEQMDRTRRVDGSFRRMKNIEAARALKAEPPPLPMSGPYRTIVTDFPWPADLDGYRDQASRGYYPYATMSLEQLEAIDIGSIAHAEGCAWWLWIPNFHLANGVHVPILRKWGFTPSTILTWCKMKFGQGQRLRGATEHAVLAVRGDVPVLGMGHRTWFLPEEDGNRKGRKREHSGKPDAFFDIVQAVTPASRYAYLFAGESVPEGWDGHGDRIDALPSEPATMEFFSTPLKPARPEAPDEPRPQPPAEPWRDGRGLNGHTVTMTIDWTTEPPHSVGTCQCGTVFRVPRDGANRDENMARAKQMDAAIEEHRRMAFLSVAAE